MQERIKVNLTLQEFLATILPGTVQPYVTEVTLPDGSVYETTGVSWSKVREAGGAALVSDKGFIPSAYSSLITMDGTAQVVALATGTRKVQIANLGATTEAVRVAFGVDATDAGDNLTISGAAATTGYYIPASAEGGGQSIAVLGVPALATHMAICNAVALDQQSVSVTQGV